MVSNLESQPFGNQAAEIGMQALLRAGGAS